jgi:hypothetical protein
MRGKSASYVIACSLTTVLVPPAFAGSPQYGQTKDEPKAVTSPPVACSVDKPIIPEGGTVILRAWVAPLNGESPEYVWTAVTGKIAGVGREVEWEFAGVGSAPHPFEAKVRITLPTRGSATCSVQVFVAEKERSGERETGRSFLIKGKKETEGYGLYSYLLLGVRPVDSNRDRYVKTIEAYLRTIEEVSELEDYIQRSKLNVTYLPLQVAPASKPSADWILLHYDYARARALLDLLPGNLREGPYIISVLKPLGSGGPSNQYLFQDLSAILPKDNDLASWWIREFLNQAAQERFWEPKTADLMVLKLRTTIAVLATALPDVRKGLDSWISWVQ